MRRGIHAEHASDAHGNTRRRLYFCRLGRRMQRNWSVYDNALRGCCRHCEFRVGSDATFGNAVRFRDCDQQSGRHQLPFDLHRNVRSKHYGDPHGISCRWVHLYWLERRLQWVKRVYDHNKCCHGRHRDVYSSYPAAYRGCVGHWGGHQQSRWN
jgi:hypothetical protein